YDIFTCLEFRGVLFRSRDRAHGEVGIRGFAQHLDTRCEYLAEGLLLAPVARRLVGARPRRLCDGGHCIAGHMSKLSDGHVPRQARRSKYQYIGPISRVLRLRPPRTLAT